ncbi:MAG: acyl carrier protein [Terriglobales bacterium]
MSRALPPAPLRAALADVLEIPSDQVTADLSAAGLPSWDSFRQLQAILALESEFQVRFDPRRMGDLTSVAALETELRALGVSFEA